MNKLSAKARAIKPPKPKPQTVVKEITPAVQNPDNNQKGKSKSPGR